MGVAATCAGNLTEPAAPPLDGFPGAAGCNVLWQVKPPGVAPADSYVAPLPARGLLLVCDASTRCRPTRRVGHVHPSLFEMDVWCTSIDDYHVSCSCTCSREAATPFHMLPLRRATVVMDALGWLDFPAASLCGLSSSNLVLKRIATEPLCCRSASATAAAALRSGRDWRARRSCRALIPGQPPAMWPDCLLNFAQDPNQYCAPGR